MKPLHESAAVELPEQLTLELPLAGVGTRGAAYLIDLAVQLLLMVVAGLAVLPLFFGARGGLRSALHLDRTTGVTSFSLVLLAFLTLVVFSINFGYFALFEAFGNGRSPGKRALGLRVVRDGGFPLDGRGALVRNLLRVVDFLPAFYFVGIVVLFAGRAGKRVGDYAAGTIVVLEGHGSRALGASAASTGALGGGARPGAPLGELGLVRAFLARRDDLEPAARLRVADQLAQRLQGRPGSAGSPAPGAERWLEQWLAEHEGPEAPSS